MTTMPNKIMRANAQRASRISPDASGPARLRSTLAVSRSLIVVQVCVAALANAAAVLWYGVGLLSPLTPSYGTPSAAELLVFVGLPVAVLGTCGALVRPFALRLTLLTEAVGIIVFSSWLVWMQTQPMGGRPSRLQSDAIGPAWLDSSLTL
jgi:hypothetical protein